VTETDAGVGAGLVQTRVTLNWVDEAGSGWSHPVRAAATMREDDRKDLAVQALARSATGDLSTGHGVSRKFVYQQANKACHALDDAFLSAATDDTVLFQVQVTKRWVRQMIVALALMCRSSYLGIIEFMRDLLGWPISIGTIHCSATSRLDTRRALRRRLGFCFPRPQGDCQRARSGQAQAADVEAFGLRIAHAAICELAAVLCRVRYSSGLL
jgi:hypothetical protein